MTLNELKIISAEIRIKLVEMSHHAKAAHLGSSLSCVDILTALYFGNILSIDPKNPKNPDRDRFILSKGHAASALYATLAYRGFFSETLLDTYGSAGSLLEEHPGPALLAGIEAATGSLGHGLSIGTGMALAGKINNKPYKVVVLISDGECNEGSVWEAALFASKHNLNNLTVIVDFNKWQATGRSCEVMSLEPLKDKWQAFGFNAVEADGHNISQLTQIMKPASSLKQSEYDSLTSYNSLISKPTAVIAHTVKGKGISFMEDDNNWHYRIPNIDELERAKNELNSQIESIIAQNNNRSKQLNLAQLKKGSAK